MANIIYQYMYIYIHAWYIYIYIHGYRYSGLVHSVLSAQDEDDDLYSDELRPGQAKGAKAASSAIV